MLQNQFFGRLEFDFSTSIRIRLEFVVLWRTLRGGELKQEKIFFKVYVTFSLWGFFFVCFIFICTIFLKGFMVSLSLSHEGHTCRDRARKMQRYGSGMNLCISRKPNKRDPFCAWLQWAQTSHQTLENLYHWYCPAERVLWEQRPKLLIRVWGVVGAGGQSPAAHSASHSEHWPCDLHQRPEHGGVAVVVWMLAQLWDQLL